MPMHTSMHSSKYWGNYACLNLCSLGSHSQVIVVPGRCPTTTPYSNYHISKLTPPNEEFLSILESPRHELRIANGLTLMTYSPRWWEAFPMPEDLTHSRITGPSRHQVPGVSLGSLLCPWCFRHPFGEMCDTHPTKRSQCPHRLYS